MKNKSRRCLNIPSPHPPSPEELGNVIRSIDIKDPLASLVEGTSAEEVAAIWKALKENAPMCTNQVVNLNFKLGGKLASSVFGKVSEDIGSVISTTKESSSFPDAIVRNSAKGISAAAKAAARVSAVSISDSKRETHIYICVVYICSVYIIYLLVYVM